MAHINVEEFKEYINGQLIDEEIEPLEAHLYTCDHCLAEYMQLADQTVFYENHHVQSPNFTADIVIQLPLIKDFKLKSKKQRFYQKPIFHYGIAAVITIALMTSGFFQDVTTVVGKVDATSPVQSTFTQNLVNKTVSLINSIEPLKGENN